MARSFPAALADEFDKQALEPFYALELEFDSGFTRLWTGYGNITANGVEWFGAGQLLGIGDSKESTDLTAEGLTVTLSGLDQTLVALALAENYRGRPAKVYIGALASGAPVSDLYQVFSGRMDTMTIQETGETSTIVLNIENVLVDLQRPRLRLYTNEEQLKRYAGDKSLEQIANLQDRQILWGKAS